MPFSVGIALIAVAIVVSPFSISWRKNTIFFRIDNAFAKNYINILSLVHPIAIYTSGPGDSLTTCEMFEDPLEKEEEKTVPHHFNDSEARDLLRKLCSDSNICAIQTFQRKERNSILESALRRGLGVRQLARLTGVSYGIIQRINEKVGQSPLTHLKTGPHTQVPPHDYSISFLSLGNRSFIVFIV